jgi:hypothetical protein
LGRDIGYGTGEANRRPGASSALDEAFERLASAGFELPNGFVNHGAMACEALDAMGLAGDVEEWARRFALIAGPGASPRLDASFEWQESLGEYKALQEWIGLFENAIGEEGWPQVVKVWVPRLIPAMATALFHGAIRAGHAVRAIAAADSAPRRAELARALGYWAARFRPGQVASRLGEVDDAQRDIVTAAAGAARYYLASPSIYFLHGVTGAMALEILAPYLSGPDGAKALAQLRAEHAMMYSGARPASQVHVVGVTRERMADVAEASGDPHEVKLVEAVMRAFRVTGDPVFAAAAETVTGLAGIGAP